VRRAAGERGLGVQPAVTLRAVNPLQARTSVAIWEVASPNTRPGSLLVRQRADDERHTMQTVGANSHHV
jgi:hypothetical protein